MPKARAALAEELRLHTNRPAESVARNRAERIPFDRFVGWGYRDNEHPNWHVIKKGIQGAVYRVDRLQPTLGLMLHDGFAHLDKVAMKVVLAASDQGDLSDEFRALAELKHPYIVQVCGFTLGSPPNRSDKSWIVILELCDRDLRTCSTRRRRRCRGACGSRSAR